MKPLIENNTELINSHCEGKYYYHTAEFAREQAKRYRERFNRPDQREYKCLYCSYYHIGSTKHLFTRRMIE